MKMRMMGMMRLKEIVEVTFVNAVLSLPPVLVRPLLEVILQRVQRQKIVPIENRMYDKNLEVRFERFCMRFWQH